MTAPPDDTTADTSAIIAALRAERDAALSEKVALAEALATHNSEFGERIEYQAATLDVLRAMSASPGDPQPVFDLIVERARDLCDAYGVTVLEFDGGLLHYRAANGVSDDAETREAFAALYPRPPTRDMPQGRAILDRQTIRIDDLEADQGLNPFYRGITSKSTVVVPLMRGEVAIGTVGIGSRERGGFSDSQIELLKTFAEQAVIAITSAETYRALQARTSDLQETLDYQTATSDVLKVISRSTFDLQPVLDTVVETAAKLCVADMAHIGRREGETINFAANYGFPPEYETYLKARGPVKLDPTSPLIGHRTLIEGRPVHVDDVATVPRYPEVLIRLGKQRTSLGVPLLRDGEAIGLIQLSRQRVEPFTTRQIELISTFADQAVIAIENTRLMTEQREALEQQTATAEVLQVINSSPGDLAPVFDAILEKAHTLCGVAQGALVMFDGKIFHASATRGLGDFASVLRDGFRPRLGSPQDQLLNGEPFVHISDAGDIDDPTAQRGFELAGVRTVLYVAMRKDHSLLGYIAASHKEVRPFSDKQIALLQNFAAQAVIAMENARLLNETREALEQQTATAEVLQVINSSPGNLAPVFDAMLDKAMRLCGVDHAALELYDGEHMHAAAVHGASNRFAETLRGGYRAIDHPAARSLLEGQRFVEVADAKQVDHIAFRTAAEVDGIGTVLFVPLRRDDLLLGMIASARRQVHPFTDKEVALLQNFAAQAVIAIENARLLTEQREALEQQTATAEVLQVINASPGNLVPVFEAILEKAHRLCGATHGSLHLFDGENFRAVATYGISEVWAERTRDGLPAVNNPVTEPLLDGARFVHVADMVDINHPLARVAAEATGVRTALFVPLRKDNKLIGAISALRREVRPFTEKEIALLENFAAQAVIAMENARLINETREALEQQTATAEVLGVINSNPGDLAPVFDAMLEKAHGLCRIATGSLELYDGQRFRAVAVRGLSGTFADMLRQGYLASENPATRPLIDGSRLTHIRDLTETDYAITRSAAELDAARTLLCVPLRREGTLLGMIASSRKEVRPFSDKEIALLENFAAQAVIAMENARLLTEQREALEQQTATAEVLQVINSSPGNLAPVFDAILEKAHSLCGADHGSLYVSEADAFRAVALRGVSDAFADLVRQPFRPEPNHPVRQLIAGDPFAVVNDASEIDDPIIQNSLKLAGMHSALFVPLRKDKLLLGYIVASSPETRVFTDKQVALLENFAAQAVIAMENARLLDEIRQRQEELRVTFENMGDGVAMFDGTQRLVAWNRNFQEILDLPDPLLEQHRTYEEHLHFLAARGDFGPGVDTVEQITELVASTGQPYGYQRTRPDGRVIEIRRNPVPDGGFVLIYSDITERKRSEAEIGAARDAAEAALRELKAAQANLIQGEKMASLGQLTAGIAHEIKNPLNFVNNFAELSGDLLDELHDAVAGNLQAEIDELTATLKSNLVKIAEHGKRADGIVRSMLEHSRGSSGERRSVDLNTLVDEALNLAYHGARAQDQSFSITLERDFSDGIAPIEVNPQDIMRALLNIFSNGFYATTRRARDGGDDGFVPMLKVTTRDAGKAVEIRVRDNGTGIPADIRDKLFQPFFTTKPTGEGTGLGLSIAYDIVTQQHGGSIAVDSKVGDYSEFTIRLPRKP